MPATRQKHALVIGIDRYRHFPHLDGCGHDAALAAEVLRERFGFPQPLLLLDEAAGREGILGALEDLAETVAEDALVVLHYSGHGSRLRADAADEADGWTETIVPSDSGRHPRANLDIRDDELHHWLLRLTRRTPHVTVVLDSCHSGTAVRAADPSRIRRAPEERRPAADLPGTRGGPPPARRRPKPPDGPSGWLSPAVLGERYTLLAACRDDEPAREHADDTGHRFGAFSWHLYRELASLDDEHSYREVFERIAPRVAAAFRQHPQLEGARERCVFGATLRSRPRWFPLVANGAGGLRLGAGSAFGLRRGCELSVRPARAPRGSSPAPHRARLRLTEVGPLSSAFEIVERREEPQAGDRAIVEVQALGEARLAVDLEEGLNDGLDSGGSEIRARIAGSELLRSAEGVAAAQVRVLRLGARDEAGEEDLLPHLGPLDGLRWAIVDAAGTLLPPLLRADRPRAAERLVRALERWSHFHRLLELDNEDPGSRLRDAVEMRLYRRDDDAWREIEADGPERLAWREGTRLGLELANRSDRPLHFAVLAFGLLAEVEQVYPPPGAEEILRPGRAALQIAMRDPGPALRVRVPERYPRPSGEPLVVEDYLKVFVTTEPVDFAPLLRPPLQGCRRPGSASHPLERLAHACRGDLGARSIGLDDDAGAGGDWGSALRRIEIEVAPRVHLPGDAGGAA
jgi:hypothetical protein